MTLKPISQQVIVITGASSGIGLATARLAAKRGARVVLAARNVEALSAAVERIHAEGGDAIYVQADVSKRDDLEKLASEVLKAYGGFDTWVNNAGVGIFGALDRVSEEDHRRLFDVNFWGIVDGTKIAAAHLKNKGGAIINVGSAVSDVAIPVQGMYAASKHAVKGFTDAFRMELIAAHSLISLTLIKPASINTPFPEHARNYLDKEPTLPFPIYQPEDVADAIIHAAQYGGRDYYVGSGGKAMSSLNKIFPSLFDWIGARMGPMQSSGPPRRARDGSLHQSASGGHMHGEPTSPVHRSLYTAAQIYPERTLGLAALCGACLAFLLAWRTQPRKISRRTRR